jgi:hypothetical protein
MWGFKAFQGLSYLLLFVLFLFAVAGEQAWQGVLDQPGVSAVLRFLSSLIHTLFSSKGLAALGSYALVNLFLGFWFYRRYRKRILKWAEKRLAGLRWALQKTWEDCLDDLSQDLTTLKEEMHTRRSALVDISQGSQGGPKSPSRGL